MSGSPSDPIPRAEPAGPTGAAASPRWVRLLVFAAFCAAALVLLRDVGHGRRPRLVGDIWEHWLIAESFHSHGTPDLQPQDMDAVYAEARRHGLVPPPKPYAYETAPDGRLYGMHFWAYAACGVPAKAYLHWAGQCELAWPALSNAMWFLLAIGTVLFGSSRPPGERFALVGLAAAGPAWHYVAWSGSELFSWAFVLIGVSAYRDRRYGWAGAAAGAAALQNPPIILFGGVAVLAALVERRWRCAAGATAGTAIGLLPYAFFLYHFGKPNLIAVDHVRTEYVSWIRGWSQLTDLSQGLLPFAPVVLAAGVFGAGRLAAGRDPRGLLLLVATVGVAVGTQVSQNWNSSCDGLQRYLVWLIPLVAGVAVAGIAPAGAGGPRLWALGATAVLIQSGLITAYAKTGATAEGYLGHSKMAKWVLTRYPEGYWAEYEVFIERTRHSDDWPLTPSEYPVGFVRGDGTVSKMLLDPESVENVAARYQVDPGYMTELRAEAAGRTGLFYAHPPHGAVRVR
ncbi:hypothetical protein [Frigoriglobus tundricola]|uniref:Glycosyltransferase RgtA/B/C/D-like domain-containing protein n=1 Tax=Frigoriglobus tundricola TaxID=2774151 RepID=A0A6M5YIE0_9BACT|nr:hypothetical protein [Frigoriglobus tundricola]QJW93080.1 hypothetical protein FTUN_0582 [Frigoriglobus tundricola]